MSMVIKLGLRSGYPPQNPYLNAIDPTVRPLQLYQSDLRYLPSRVREDCNMRMHTQASHRQQERTLRMVHLPA